MSTQLSIRSLVTFDCVASLRFLSPFRSSQYSNRFRFVLHFFESNSILRQVDCVFLKKKSASRFLAKCLQRVDQYLTQLFSESNNGYRVCVISVDKSEKCERENQK